MEDRFLNLLKLTAAFALLGLILMLLWNWLMPLLFGFSKITYLQALGIKVLSSLLFKKFNLELDND